ncbi:MAG: orotidine-5'-phosphate decarboxylase [Blastochloris sp.]|nr:orotidine-5'-phosphate decarboxylase [Blastochloris sp.]
MTPDQIILALDVHDPKEALSWVDRFQGRIGTFKIGLQLFSANGPSLVREMRKKNVAIFLDLKLHDIPNTVAKSIEALCQLDLRFLTIHCSGGRAMMEAAAQAALPFPQTTLLGVTVLTHLSDDDVRELGYDHSSSGQVLHFARLAQSSGVQALVCSPLEVPLLRREFPPEAMKLVTPGVRPLGSATDDQSRIATPQQSLAEGSTHVVIGRPILNAPDPDAVLDSLLS